MFGLIAGIVGLIAAGCLVAYTVVLTIRWLTNKINEKFNENNVKKVAAIDLDKMIESCNNTIPLNELGKLNTLSNEGYTHAIASVDDNGKVIDVEVFRDERDTIDGEVEQLLNRTGEGILVVDK